MNSSNELIRVLIVDDDLEIRSMLRRTLLAEGFIVDSAGSAEQGIELVRTNHPDVMVLDIGLPGDDGITAVRQLRDAGKWTPILMLTAATAIDSRIESLRAGADDFLSKPFNSEELVLRLRSLVRRDRLSSTESARTHERTASTITVGDITIDTDARTCQRAGKEINLSPREFDLLVYLAKNCGITLSRHRIADEVWEGETGDDANVVDVYVGYLRRKLEAKEGAGRVIHTVRGHGFRLDEG